MKSRRHFRAVPVMFPISIVLILGCAQLMAQECPGPCLWERGGPHKMHWPQAPDQGFTGVGVSLSGTILADDFTCTATGPVRAIHLWGSFRDDVLPKTGPDSLTFELCIYSDSGEVTWSRPGELLWSQAFKPGQYATSKVHEGPEDWYDPADSVYIKADHRDTYRYSFCIEQEPFLQEAGTAYWLAVRELYSGADYAFGWKTTAQRFHWSDDAVYLRNKGEDWLEMAYPKGHTYSRETLDLAFVVAGDSESQPQFDLGDAPDSSSNVPGIPMTAYADGTPANFPTVYHAGSPPYGPRHLYPRDMFYLGQWVSLEAEADIGLDEDGVNNLSPTQNVANRDGGDDGVQLPVVMPSCGTTTLSYTVTVTNTAAKQAYVNVWCDWNRDGDWNDTVVCPDGEEAPEWAVQNQKISLPMPGVHAFVTPSLRCWHPAKNGIGAIWLRITIAEHRWEPSPGTEPTGGAGPQDGYLYGETEDYCVVPLEEPAPAQYDWGDTPDAASTPGYPTLKANNGARHAIAGPWLGDEHGAPDAEANGQPHPNALGDDDAGENDEMGVSIPPLVPGRPTSATVQVSGGGGVVQGWIDFNGDRAWRNGEKICDTFLPDGVHVVPFTVPSSAAAGRTFARFRISREGGLTPYGEASNGEVEDHEVRIDAMPDLDKMWCQLPDLSPHGVAVHVDGADCQAQAIADNFECRNPGRLTHIRLWGAWQGDDPGTIVKVRVRIHSDDPAGLAGPDKKNRYPTPGPEILWHKEFPAGQFEEALYHVNHVAGQWWRDPLAGTSAPGCNARVWQIDMEVEPDEAFEQDGLPDGPRVYWLAVEVETLGGQFGWNVRQWLEPFRGDAVWNAGPCLAQPWQELYYPIGHEHYDVERNSMDMAFCLLFTEAGPEPVTCRPVSITQCPTVETMCPSLETQCPALATRCPAVSTKCPPSITSCPTVQTVCPNPETQCPMVQTQCPGGATVCPAVATQCPATPTQCPTQQTRCPISQTQCPVIETACPQTQTWCPLPTWCPATPTSCPLALTQCPTAQTLCPAVQTMCPPVQTSCPSATACCPGTDPICTFSTLQQPDEQSEGMASWQTVSCPVVETACADISGYLDVVMPSK